MDLFTCLQLALRFSPWLSGASSEGNASHAVRRLDLSSEKTELLQEGLSPPPVHEARGTSQVSTQTRELFSLMRCLGASLRPEPLPS